MPTANTAATQSAPAAELPAFAFGGRTFSFSMELPVAEDKAGSRTTQGEALPFPAMFDYFLAPALEGKQPSFFVPTSLWQERSDAYFDSRGLSSQKKTLGATNNKDKMRDQFKKWQDAATDDVNKAQRKAVRLGFATRTGKEGIEGVTEPGVTVWVLKA